MQKYVEGPEEILERDLKEETGQPKRTRGSPDLETDSKRAQTASEKILR
jgi:hypothetical protein